MLSAFAALGTLVGLAFSLALLFLPTLVAKSRNRPNTLAIFFYAPVYHAVIAAPHHPAVANPAISILPPASTYRGAR